MRNRTVIDWTSARSTRTWLFAAALLFAAANGCGTKTEPPTSITDDTTAPERTEASRRNTTTDTSVGRVTDDSIQSPNSPPKSSTTDKRPASPAPVPQPIFRASDARPQHNDVKLAAFGIRLYESKRLKLYTDIDAKLAAKLPPLIDAAYEAWEEYFGKLSANRERTDFQVTGYLMKDASLFRDAGLIPADLRPFVNGRHRGAEFWMNDQTYDYYRRHLVIHESTHCFMEAVAGERYYEGLPAWYWEGMAELFGTHRFDAKGKATFRVMPDDRENFAGLGRITLVRDAVAAGKRKSPADVVRLKATDYLDNDAYAWSWALCEFLDTHPVYQKRFHEFGRLLTGSRFMRAWEKFLADYQGRLPAEWSLFADGIQYGYDIERAAIEFRAGQPLAGEERQANIRADRGWQSSGLRVEGGKKYRISAAGRFTLAQVPKPWISDAGGISFDYFGGRPLGLLLVRIHRDGSEMLPAFIAGRRHEFIASDSGTLYFRLNDSWSRLEDNEGQVTVTVLEVSGSTKK